MEEETWGNHLQCPSILNRYRRKEKISPSRRKKWPYPYRKQLLATEKRLCQHGLFRTLTAIRTLPTRINHQNQDKLDPGRKTSTLIFLAPALFWSHISYLTASQSTSFRRELTGSHHRMRSGRVWENWSGAQPWSHGLIWIFPPALDRWMLDEEAVAIKKMVSETLGARPIRTEPN